MYEELKEKFRAKFGREPGYIFSAPGRTELGGNHTDHQLGLVLAGAVDVDSVAAVGENGLDRIRVLSEGYPLCDIDLKRLEPAPEEAESTAALVRGVAAGFKERGLSVPGFDAAVTSRILPGSGLSSSAAFEVLIGTALNKLTGAGLDPVEVAKIGQYAENRFFGKPCGLMDQTASAVGGIISIDFADPAAPRVRHIDFDFSTCGHALCIISAGAGHADLTADYASITDDLARVCRVFGREKLRQVPEEEFYASIAQARAAAGDRAVLRAMHVYEENRRVTEETEALERGDFGAFLEQVRSSGRSSWMYLQNVIPTGRGERQELAFALALAEKLLAGRGACRVHGGGFAGTIQAFVPEDMLESFRGGMEKALGEGACQALSIRARGGVMLEEL